jgi:hypothetical protein
MYGHTPYNATAELCFLIQTEDFLASQAIAQAKSQRIFWAVVRMTI